MDVLLQNGKDPQATGREALRLTVDMKETYHLEDESIVKLISKLKDTFDHNFYNYIIRQVVDEYELLLQSGYVKNADTDKATFSSGVIRTPYKDS